MNNCPEKNNKFIIIFEETHISNWNYAVKSNKFP